MTWRDRGRDPAARLRDLEAVVRPQLIALGVEPSPCDVNAAINGFLLRAYDEAAAALDILLGVVPGV